MTGVAEKSDPKLWDKVKAKVTKGDHGGKPGQWSARKAQMTTSEYKKAGGGYKGEKAEDNHLKQWTDEDWGTKSGNPSGETGERYLPKDAREHLSEGEYARTSEKKRSDTRKGKQFSGQPKDIARKTKPYRSTGETASLKTRAKAPAKTTGKDTAKTAAKNRDREPTRDELYARARAREIPGRSRMSRDELARAVA